MKILATVGAYLLAFIFPSIVELLAVPLTIGLVFILRKMKPLTPLIIFLFDVCKMALVVVGAACCISKIGQRPAWLMFIIPGLFIVGNGRQRIERVKSGQSKVKQMLERGGESDAYDQVADLRTEQAHLFGDVVGWSIGASIALRHSTFI